MDVVAGALFIVVVGALIRTATKIKAPVVGEVPVAPSTLLGVVPPPRSELIIDSHPVES